MLISFEKEVRAQLALLAKMQRSKADTLPEGSILVGAGDSYAAALCASYLSSMRTLALDPYELMTSPEAARSKTVVFVSVSGRTRSNVVAARRVESRAAETIVVTAEESSPLAKAADRTILLPYEYRPKTPGMASFALSLMACARLSCPDFHLNFAHTFSTGRRISQRFRFSRGGVTFFLGNRALYAISIYAAAKLYEFFGARAAYQRLEEFSHMELFSLDPRDAVNIYEGFDPLRNGRRLAKSLREAGYDSFLASTGRLKEPERVFTAVFATQLAVLRRAGEMKTDRPYISDAKKKLAISDSMIY